MLQSVGLIIVLTSACMTGVAVFAYYAMKGCDPLTNGDIQSSNQVTTNYRVKAFRGKRRQQENFGGRGWGIVMYVRETCRLYCRHAETLAISICTGLIRDKTKNLHHY